MKKLTAVLLTLAIVFAIVPITAIAQNDDPVLLVINSDAAASGDGWDWNNNILTISKNGILDAVRIESTVTSAKIVITQNITLNSQNLSQTSALYAACDLEIDTGEYSLSLYADEAIVLHAAAGLIISGGSVYTQCGSFKYRDVTVSEGNLKIQNAMLVSRVGGIYVNGALTAANAHLSAISNDYNGISAHSVSLVDSTVFAESITAYGIDCSSITVDNCNIEVSGDAGVIRADYHYGKYTNTNSIRFTNLEMEYPYEYTATAISEENENGDIYSWTELFEDGYGKIYYLIACKNTYAEQTGKVLELYVGGVNALLHPDGDGWHFDAENGILTLDNCTLTQSHVSYYDTSNTDALIYFQGQLVLELIGENHLERTISVPPSYYTSYSAICGDIYMEGTMDLSSSLYIQGSGNLTAGVVYPEEALDWELEWCYGIHCETSLSGLRDGGWADIYCGVTNYPRAAAFRAFWCSPSWSDNSIVVAYSDVEGTLENEYGYNWNNNDGWRMKFITDSSFLHNNGLLTINNSSDSSGEGWNWHDNVLTLSSDTEVKAVEFTRNLTHAKLNFTGDVTLDSTEMSSASPISASCDLEINTNGHSLTLQSNYTAVNITIGDLLISGGELNIQNEYDYAICVNGGNLTIRNTSVTTEKDFYTTSAYDEFNDWTEVPGGTIAIENSTITAGAMNSYADINIVSSNVSLNGEWYTLSAQENTTLKNSTVNAILHSQNGSNVYAYEKITIDNCNITISGGAQAFEAGYTYNEADLGNLIFINVSVIQPTSYQIASLSTSYGSNYVTVLDENGNAAVTFTAQADLALEEHICIWGAWTADTEANTYTRTCTDPACGKTETFTLPTDKPLNSTSGSNAANTDLIGSDIDLIDQILTDEELSEMASGKDVTIYLTAEDISGTVSTEEKQIIQATAPNSYIGMYLDIDLYKKIADSNIQVNRTFGPITITIRIPDSLINRNDFAARSYSIIRVHDEGNGNLTASLLEGVFDANTQTFTFQTDCFSTYALAYYDVPADTPTQKGDVNLDGNVNMDDVTALMRHVLKAQILTDETSLSMGEVTGDNTLNMDDVTKLMRYVLKATDSLD